MKPTVKITKNKIIDQNPNNGNAPNETTHGNKNETSKSKIRNRIATK